MGMRGYLAPLFILVCVTTAAQGPQPVWTFPVDSVVQPAPLVAEIDDAPGLETIVAGAAGRQLVCLRANGKEAWRLEPAFATQLSTPPALSSNAVMDGVRVAAAFGNEVVSIDPTTPGIDWSATVADGPVQSVHWADVDGDTWHDLIAVTATVIHVYDARGMELIVAQGEPDAPLSIAGPLAVADADLNDFAELYGVGAKGVFSVDDRGLTRWQAATDTAFAGAPIIADTDGDSFAELYAVTVDGAFLQAFDADLGDSHWKTWLPGTSTVGTPALAAGDLDGDGMREVLVGLPSGRVYAVTSEGAIVWNTQPGETAAVSLGLGDVDGNSAVEVLVASLDGGLYALDAKGNTLWRYETGRALTHPPVIIDLDQDGKTDMVFAGRDGYVRCVSLGARFLGKLVPWPELGGGPARTYAAVALSEDAFAEDAAAGPVVMPDTMSLLPLAEFDQAAKDGALLGWTRVSSGEATLVLDPETKLTGAAALRVEAQGEPCVLVSELVPLDTELRGISGAISAQGPTAALAAMRWLGDAGVVREDPLEAGQPLENGWRRFTLAQMAPPPGAKWLALVITTETGEAAWWDSGQVMGTYERLPAAGVFYNQVGYEMGAPKHFTAWCNVQPLSATFELLNQNNDVVYQGNLSRPDRITDAYGRSWERYYARGDFSTVDEPGTYRLRVKIDDTVTESEPFEIAEDILWSRLLPAALEYLNYMASGRDIPNFHEAWHLDDARAPDTGAQLDLSGGWYDDGRFAKREAVETLTCLGDAWEVAAWRLKEMDNNRDGVADIVSAITFGAGYVQKLAAAEEATLAGVATKPGYIGDPGQQTDNQPGTGDEREAVAGGRDDELAYALALAGRATGGAYNATAATAIERARAANTSTPALFGAAMQLYDQTGEASWGDLSKTLAPESAPGQPWVPYTEMLIVYEDAFIAAISAQLAMDQVAFANALCGLAANPFGVVTYGPPDKTHFFAPEAVPAGEALGNTGYLLRMALSVARAHRFAPSVELKTFVYDQLNWLLGNNPMGISLIEGQGRTFLPAYHSQVVFNGIDRGALPGGIANGFVPRGPGDGRPFIDMRKVDLPDWRTNACATKNAALLIDVIANFKRADFLKQVRARP